MTPSTVAVGREADLMPFFIKERLSRNLGHKFTSSTFLDLSITSPLLYALSYRRFMSLRFLRNPFMPNAWLLPDRDIERDSRRHQPVPVSVGR